MNAENENSAETPSRSRPEARGSVASVHFSSATPEWATPQPLFDQYDSLHNFTLDPCSTSQNAKCRKHYTREHDGLAQDWNGERVWMNPPYGREISKWMKKAYEASLAGALVVCLVPARTDTHWWHEYAMKGKIEFLRGRVKFVGGAHSAPFPSAVVTLTPPNAGTQRPGQSGQQIANPNALPGSLK